MNGERGGAIATSFDKTRRTIGSAKSRASTVRANAMDAVRNALIDLEDQSIGAPRASETRPKPLSKCGRRAKRRSRDRLRRRDRRSSASVALPTQPTSTVATLRAPHECRACGLDERQPIAQDVRGCRPTHGEHRDLGNARRSKVGERPRRPTFGDERRYAAASVSGGRTGHTRRARGIQSPPAKTTTPRCANDPMASARGHPPSLHHATGASAASGAPVKRIAGST